MDQQSHTSSHRDVDPRDELLHRVDEIAQQVNDCRNLVLSANPSCGAEPASLTATRIRRQLKARRVRESFFGPDLFSDPAWDILLEGFAAYIEKRDTSVTALCNAAAVPSTTAMRWIRKLEKDGFLIRRADSRDGRRVWINLTDEAGVAMRRYLDQISVTLPL